MKQKERPTRYPVPLVGENTGRGGRRFNISGGVQKAPIVSRGTPSDAGCATGGGAQLLFLQSEDREKESAVNTNGRGGGVPGGLAIYDPRQYTRPPVST